MRASREAPATLPVPARRVAGGIALVLSLGAAVATAAALLLPVGLVLSP